jgi:hypothetical protein
MEPWEDGKGNVTDASEIGLVQVRFPTADKTRAREGVIQI